MDFLKFLGVFAGLFIILGLVCMLVGFVLVVKTTLLLAILFCYYNILNCVAELIVDLFD